MDEYDNFPPIEPPKSGSVLRDDGRPPQNIEVEVIEKEDDVLRFTQRSRQQIVKSLMSKDLNDLNSAQISLLAGMLDGMDRSAMGRKRLQTDEKVGNANAMAAAVIAQVLANPGAMKAGQIIDGQEPRRALPVLPADVPEPTTVPGEMDSDSPQMNYDTFMAQTSGEGA